jgi:hypothetical protein
MFARAIVLWLAFVFFAQSAAAAVDTETMCRPFFGNACSEAMGRWLPPIPNAGESHGAPTTAADEIVDSAGRGELRFMEQRGVYEGTLFVYGKAGPPKGHAVYDPVHRIAYYDEGCCSWHHVVIASNVSPPPKKIATRSLARLKTKRGIELGVGATLIQSIYGPATQRVVAETPDESTLSYTRVIKHPAQNSPCEARTTFLFARNRLIGMDFTDAC